MHNCHFRRLLAAWLCGAIIATAMPWMQIHAHPLTVAAEHLEGDHERTDHQADVDVAHLEGHHHDGGTSDGLHVHDHGLFSHCPAVVIGLAGAFLPISSDQVFPEPALRHLSQFHSRVDRPPAA